jgi:hypothetical protein
MVNKMLRVSDCIFYFLVLVIFSYQGIAQNIDTSYIKKHLEYLASDSCEGRATGSAGEQRAAEYIKKHLTKFNLQPAYDNNSFYQQVPMHGSIPLPDTELKIYLDSIFYSLVLNKDYLLYNSGASTFLPTPLPLVFVGYGIIAPEYDYNDYQEIDVEGKIVVFLSGEPFSDDPEYFNGPMETIYNNPDSKQRLAISRGASGSILLLKPEDRKWDYWQRQFQFEDVSLSYSVSSNLSILLNPNIAKDLFKIEKYDLEKIYELHKTNRMISFELTSKLSLKSFYDQRDFVAKNVVGLLQGNHDKLHDEYVLLSAHYDHLGIGPAVSGDSIYNGAFDNAAGVSVLLELARNLASQKNLLKRSILFVFTTGEEKGLLGATYYTDHPLKALYKTIININIDGISSFDETNDFIVFGIDYSDIGKLVQTVLNKKSLALYNSPEFHLMEMESINRSDHFAFAKAGIPFLVVLEGLNYRNTTKEAGLQRLLNWQNTIYHTPRDDLNQPVNYAAVKQHTALLLDLCITIANSDEAPQWQKDSPFLLRRLQSIAERR